MPVDRDVRGRLLFGYFLLARQEKVTRSPQGSGSLGTESRSTEEVNCAVAKMINSRRPDKEKPEMITLITGSAGHLGEALMRTLRDTRDVIGVDIKPSAYTDHVGSIAERAFVHDAMRGVDTVLHTATLHKPHVATHTRQDFVDTNISGTLNLLE